MLFPASAGHMTSRGGKCHIIFAFDGKHNKAKVRALL